MKRILFLIIIAGFALPAGAQEWWNDNPSFVVPIREVTVSGQRPLKEIGTQRTPLDSTVLHENIALSMADVLAFNTSIFLKQYGRATLSTVAFRGTADSHTQVTWNGMRINSPMLGMTDFSMIPAYFIDDAELLHGASSVNVAGGGLGGAVTLSTKPADTRGFNLQYIQGVGSFRTTDEFLRLTWGNDRWQTSTRVVYSSSPNEYSFVNYDKMENVYDDEKNIVGRYHPKEKHRDGDFHDLHLLQEAYYNTGTGHRFGLNAWYLESDRGLGEISVKYSQPKNFINEQRERTFRGVLSWDRLQRNYKLAARAGYIHSRMNFDYANQRDNGDWNYMTASRSRVNTVYGSAEIEYYPGNNWLFTANAALHQHFVLSKDRNVILEQNERAVVGYDKARIELSTYASAKWTPIPRLGLSLALRQDSYGTEWTPPIPAFFTDCLLARRGNVRLKASVSRNYRFPTLNDLYFQPGGNPDLVPEHGFTWDGGVSFRTVRENRYALEGEITWFDSRIDDWIVWLPLGSKQQFWTPVNLKKVHAYGLELKAGFNYSIDTDWQLGLNGSFSWTPSLNDGEPYSLGDLSIGKQLPYVPEFSASASGHLAYRSWRLLYKWNHYSERYTMSSNAASYTGRIPPYYMNDVTLEKLFAASWADLSAKIAVRNLFDEEYLSVLSRPMPGINFEVFLGIKPRWNK